jgi:hypothetical protein
MQMEMVRTQSPAMVRKEVALHLLASNLIRGIMAEAARVGEVKPRMLSFKGALHTCEPPTHRSVPKGSFPPPHRLDEGPWVPPAIASLGVGQLFSSL